MCNNQMCLIDWRCHVISVLAGERALSWPPTLLVPPCPDRQRFAVCVSSSVGSDGTSPSRCWPGKMTDQDRVSFIHRLPGPPFLHCAIITNIRGQICFLYNDTWHSNWSLKYVCVLINKLLSVPFRYSLLLFYFSACTCHKSHHDLGFASRKYPHLYKMWCTKTQNKSVGSSKEEKENLFKAFFHVKLWNGHPGPVPTLVQKRFLCTHLQSTQDCWTTAWRVTLITFLNNMSPFQLDLSNTTLVWVHLYLSPVQNTLHRNTHYLNPEAECQRAGGMWPGDLGLRTSTWRPDTRMACIGRGGQNSYGVQ